MKATALRFKRTSVSEDSTDPVSPSRKLLEETSDEDESDHIKNNESIDGEMNGSYASTNASFNNQSSYAINQE